MRVLAGALLAVLATGPDLPGTGSLAVTMTTHPVKTSCAALSTATITVYDTVAVRDVAYRFVRSDGTVSPTRHLALAGIGAVAQSVGDQWKPRGAAPWVALEITAPQHVRSQRVAVASRCARRVVAETR